MTGGHDPANRGAFPWHRPETWNLDLLHDFQRMIALRHAHPSLRRGTFTFLYAENDIIAYARQFEGETMLIALNVAKATRRLDLSLGGLVADGAEFAEIWTKNSIVAAQGSIGDLVLAPRSGRVFQATVTR